MDCDLCVKYPCDLCYSRKT